MWNRNLSTCDFSACHTSISMHINCNCYNCIRDFRSMSHYYAFNEKSLSMDVFPQWCDYHAFSALTLLVGWEKGIQPPEWWGAGVVMSGARCKWFVCGPANATATPSSPDFVKIRNDLPFWCRLTQVILEKKPLNGCSSCSSSKFGRNISMDRNFQPMMSSSVHNQRVAEGTATTYYFTGIQILLRLL